MSLLSVLIMFMSQINWYVFADDCQSCYVTPDQVYKYINSVKKILNIINVKWANSFNTSSSSNSSSSAWNVFEEVWNKTQNTWKKAVWSAESAYDSIRMSLVLTKDMSAWFSDDVMASYKVISNTDVGIRDWKLLVALDNLISDKIYKIWAANLVDKQISKNDTVRINKELKNIELFGDIEINWATYSDLMWLLWDINTFYKNIYLDFTFSNSKDIDHEENAVKIRQGYWSRFSMSIDRTIIYDYIEMMKKQYECSTKASVCPWPISEFWNDVNKILDSTWKDASKTVEKVKKSYNRLKEVLSKIKSFWKDNFTKSMEDKKNWLLARTQWINATQVIWYTWTWWVWKMWDKTKEDVINPWMSLVDDADRKAKQFFSKPIDLKEAERVKVGEDYTDSFKEVQFESDLASIINWVYTLHDKNTTNVVMENPAQVTSLFPSLSMKVYNNINVIWSSDKEWSISKNMIDACEQQCSNFKSKCSE